MHLKHFEQKLSQGKYAAVIASVAAASTGLFTAFINFNDDDSSRPRNGNTSAWQSVGSGFFIERYSVEVVDLTGLWSFAVGDDPQRATEGFDDQTWTTIEVGAPWEDQGAGDYDGFAWYRRSFEMPASDSTESVYLRLGRIDDADEVYFNGVKIGATGGMPPEYSSGWAVSRAYGVPRDLIDFGGDNLVAVRVFDGKHGGGMRGDTVGIYTSKLPAPLLDLSGQWQLSTEDDPSFASPETSEDSFRSVVVPGAWDRQGWAEFDGYAWYRRTFSLTAPIGATELVLMLGKIDDKDEVYLNGVLIGETGRAADPAVDYWKQIRAYPFAADLLKAAGNVLAVRVYDDRAQGGITSGPIGIMTAVDHANYLDGSVDRRGAWQRSWDWLLGRS